MADKTLSLKQIFSQDKAVGALQQAFAAGKMPHAYIFAGSDGVGRATTAKAWAKMLLCHNRLQTKTAGGLFFDSCGACDSCLLFEGQGHPDYVSVYKELLAYTTEGKNRKPPLDMPVSVIREFLIEKVAGRPQQSDHVVYVVYEVEKLNASGQNALLKTLEEPPSFCLIILLCSKPDKLLATIHSRCQTVRFGPVDQEHIMAVLRKHGISDAAAGFWSRFCEGSLGQALSWATLDCDGRSIYEIKKELIRRTGEFQLGDTIDFAEWLSQSAKAISTALGKTIEDVSTTDVNRRGQRLVIQMILWAVSDAMRMSLGVQDGIVNSDQLGEISKLAARIDCDRATELVWQIQQKINWIDSSVNEKLIFEGLLLNLAGLDILSKIS